MALLLYAYDAARVLSPHQLLLVEAAGGRLRPLSADNPFTPSGRTLALAPLHLPHRGVFLAAWGRGWADPAELEAGLRALGRLRGRLRAPRALASLAAGLLFLAGPALTLGLGAGPAVIVVAALLYPTVLVTAVMLWWRRRELGLSPWRWAGLGLELLVCPAFLPNLVRRLTARLELSLDGAQLVAATAAPEVREEFLGRLQARAESMLEAAGLDRPAQDRLRAYLTALGSGR